MEPESTPIGGRPQWYLGSQKAKTENKKAETKAIKIVGQEKIANADEKNMAISAIFKQELENRTEVELLSLKDEKLQYRVSGEAEIKTVNIKPETGTEATWSIKEIGTRKSPVEVKVRRLKLKKLYRNAKKDLPTDYPIATFLIKYLILPHIVLFKFIFDKSKEHAGLRLEKMMIVGSPQNPKEVRSLFRHQKRMLERLGNPQDAAKLNEAIQNSRDIEKAIAKGTLTEKCESFAKKIKETPGEITLPGGYHDDEGAFHPVIYTLWHGKDENIIKLFKWDLGGHNGRGAGETEWDITSVDKEKLAQALNLLLAQTTPETPTEANLTKSETKIKDVFRGGLAQAKIEAATEAEPPKATTEESNALDKAPGNLVENLLQKAGAIILKKTGDEDAPMADGWELMQRILEETNGDPDSAGRMIELTSEVINEQVQLLQKAAKTSSPQEAEFLENKIWQLRDRMEELFGETEAKSLIKEILPVDLQTVTERSDKVEPPTMSGVIVLSNEEIKEIQNPPTLDIGRFKDILQVHAETIATLREQFNNINQEKALASYTTLANAIDDLVEAGKFKDAIKLAEVVQDTLPIPTAQSIAYKQNFWSPADSWDTLNSWGNLIDKITKAQWESSLRLHRRHLEPREMLGMMNSRAILVKIARNKSRWVKNKYSNAETLYRDIRGTLSPESIQKCKEAGISYEHLATLVFDDYQTDSAQFENILQFHPHYRMGAYPHLEKKAFQIKEFFKAPGLNGGAGKDYAKMIRLDAQVDAPEKKGLPNTSNKSYCKQNDDYYYHYLQKIAEEYGESFEPNVWSNVKIKPQEIQHLQRHTAMFQMMYRPEFSTALRFGEGPKGMMAAYSWWKKITKKAKEETDTEEQCQERGVELAYKEMTKCLDNSMKGRLDIGVTTYVIGEFTLVIKSSRGSKDLYYLPWGLGFPEEMAAEFTPMPDDFSAAEIAGNLPKERVTAFIGPNEGQEISPNILSKIDNDSFETKKTAQAFQEIEAHTEAGLLKLYQREPSDINPVDRYILNALSVVSNNDFSPYSTGSSTIFEALTLAISRPDLLENAEVRQLLDLKITTGFALREIINTKSEALQHYGQELTKAIEKQIEAKNVHAAAYLIHLGELIGRHAQEQNADAVKDAMPGYTTKFFENQKNKHPIKGIDTIRELAKTEPDLVMLSEIESEMLASPRNIGEWVNTLNNEKLAHLLSYQPFLETLEGREGTPMFNTMMLNWVEETLLPSILGRLTDQETRNTVLDTILGEIEEQHEKGDWKQEGDENAELFRKGQFVIDTRTMVIRKDGEVLNAASKQALLPPLVRDLLPEVDKLLPHTTSAERMRGTTSGEWIYKFTHNNTEYEVLYDTANSKASLFRYFKSSEEKSDSKYRLYNPDVKGTGAIALIRQQGLWIAPDNPTRGILQLPEKAPPTDLDRINVNLNEKGAIQSLTTVNGRPIEIPSERLLQDIASTVHPNHVLYLPPHKDEPAELHLLDQNIVLKNINNTWQLQHKKAILNLISADTVTKEARSSKLTKDLGEKVALRFQNLETKEECLLVWPHRITKTRAGRPIIQKEENYAAAGEYPVAEIKIKDGTITASSGSFLYLAYDLLKRKEYKQATHMLEQAQAGSIETTTDKELFKHVANLIRTEDPKVINDMAFFLKAELTIVEIERIQLGIIPYSPRLREEHLDNVNRIAKLQRQYDNKLEKHPPDESLKQTLEEANRFQQYRREAFENFLQRPAATSFVAPPHTLAAVKDSSLPNDFLLLVATLTKTKTANLQNLKNPGLLTSRHVLSNFAHYYNAIQKGDLEIKDLQCLYQPLEDSRQVLNDREKNFVKNADLARRILIQTALTHTKKPTEEIDPKKNATNEINTNEILKLRKWMPKKLESGITFRLIAKKLWENIIKGEESLTDQEPKKIIKLLNEQITAKLKYQIDNQLVDNDRLGMNELLSSTKLTETLPPPEGSIDVNDALEHLDDISDKLKFSDIEKTIFKATLEECRRENKKHIPLNEILSLMELAIGLSPIDMRREQELRVQANTLENTLADASETEAASNYTSQDIKGELKELSSSLRDIEKYFKAPKTYLTETIPNQINVAFSDEETKTAAEKEEFKQIRAGAKEVTAKICDQELQYKREIDPEKLDDLSKLFTNQLNAQELNTAQNIYTQARCDLLTWADTANIPTIFLMTKNRELYSDQDILDAIIDCYQMGTPAIANQEAIITKFLCAGTTVQQLKKGLETVDGLIKIQKNIDTGKLSREAKNIQENAFTEESRKLCELMDRNLNATRYLDENNQLTNARLNRKFLVSEYRLSIILRTGQREKVIAIDKDPNQWVSLRMGEGKTFYIMPVVAALLAEKKILPVMLVPSQLQTINKADFDRTTKALYGIRAKTFTVDLSISHSAAYLADEYLDMLKTRNQRGYLVTSVDTLAGITNLGQELREQRNAIFSQIKRKVTENNMTINEFIETEEGKNLALQKQEISKRLFWIRKMELLLDGDPTTNAAKIRTHFFGDEVDSILHISKEINRALGDGIPLNRDVRNLASSLFDALFDTPNQNLTSEEQRGLKKLSQALDEGTQVAIDPKELKKLLPALTKQALASEEIKDLLTPEGAPNLLTTLNREEFLNYLLGKTDKLPKGLKWDDNAAADTPIGQQQIRIAALKHLISKTFPSLYSSDPGQNFVLSENNGALAVPAVLGGEVEGSRFGDEYELICFNYLAHIQIAQCKDKKNQTETFYQKALRQMQATDAPAYAEIEKKCRTILGKPPGIPMNLELLAKTVIENKNFREVRCSIVDRIIFDGQMVTRFKEQITTPAQRVVSGRDVGGATGTLNPYALPGYRPDLTQAVGRGAFLNTVAILTGKQEEEIPTIEEDAPEVDYVTFNEKLNEGKTIKERVANLRKLPEGKGKTFVWVERQENQTTLFIWEPAGTILDTEPVETTYDKLKGRTDWIGVLEPPEPGSTRAVEAETFIKAAANLDKGLQETIFTFNDASPEEVNVKFNDILEDSKTVAIINEGGYGLEGKTITNWIEELRNQNNGKEKTFVWLEQVETHEGKKTKIFIWEPNDKKPTETSADELRRRTEPWIGVFGPQFTRGADLPLGVGNTHYLTSRASNLQDMGQSIWRGRGTGDRHTPIWHVPKSISGKEEWTLGDAYRAVTNRGVQDQGSLNESAQRFRITEFANLRIRQFLNNFAEEEREENFWSIDNADRAFILERFDNRLHALFRSNSIKNKSIDFKSDFAPSKEDKTLKIMSEMYDSEIKKLESQKKQMGQAAADVFLELAQEGGKGEDLAEKFKDWHKENSETLSALIGLPEETIKEELKGKSPEEADLFLGNKFMAKLFDDTFDAYPAERGANPFVSAMEKATDKVEDRLIELLTAKIEGKEKTKNPKTKEKVRQCVEDSINGKGNLAELLSVHLNDKSIIEKARMGKNYGQTFGIAFSSLWTKVGNTLRSKENQKEDLFSQKTKEELAKPETKDTLEKFTEAIKEIRKSKEEWSGDEFAPMIAGLRRMADAKVELDSIITDLEAEKKRFNLETSKTEHAKYVPEITESASSTSGVQEQVQQQQQQQQTVRAQSPKTHAVDLDASVKKEFTSWSVDLLEKPNTAMSSFIPDCNDWGVDNIFLTEEAKDVLKALPSLRGDSIWKFAVNKEGQVILLSKQDYYAVVNPKATFLPLMEVKTFSIVPGDNIQLDGDNKPLESATIRTIAILKLRLGYQEFSDEEQKQLAEWKQALPSKQKKNLEKWAKDQGIILTRIRAP